MTTDESKGSTKVVLITGASSGIGEATARLLADKGLQVVLGARRTDRLETIVSQIRAQGGTAEYHALDVTNLEEMQAFVGFANDCYQPTIARPKNLNNVNCRSYCDEP